MDLNAVGIDNLNCSGWLIFKLINCNSASIVDNALWT